MRIVAGTFRGRTLKTLKTVDGTGYRPAMARVREALFSMLEARGVVWSACTVLDLFAGSGSLAFEALSRGAAGATLVESAPRAVGCLRANARALGLDESRCRIIDREVITLLDRRPHRPFEVIFIDPPYDKNLLPPTLRRLLDKGWLAQNAIVTAEVESAVPCDAATYEHLELLVERRFGQTRIFVWTLRKPESLSIPAPLIRSPTDM